MADSIVINETQSQDPAQNGQSQTPQNDGRPEWLPEKFWDATAKAPKYEDLAKSYVNLEGQFTKMRQTAAPKPNAQATPPADNTNADPNAPPPGVSKVDMAKYSSEWEQTGELSEASYKELEARGFDKDTVDAYIDGQVARAERVKSEIFSAVGGEENYIQMAEWAKANLSPQDITAFNKAVNSQDVAQIKLAVSGLYSRFVQSNPTPPNLVFGNGPVTGVQGFRSTEEVRMAMSDPRYAADEAYRNDVIRKLAVSNVF